VVPAHTSLGRFAKRDEHILHLLRLLSSDLVTVYIDPVLVIVDTASIGLALVPCAHGARILRLERCRLGGLGLRDLICWLEAEWTCGRSWLLRRGGCLAEVSSILTLPLRRWSAHVTENWKVLVDVCVRWRGSRRTEYGRIVDLRSIAAEKSSRSNAV